LVSFQYKLSSSLNFGLTLEKSLFELEISLMEDKDEDEDE
jgi:hypothetical protein